MPNAKEIKYPVIEPLKHNGERYMPGDAVLMTEKCAAACSAVVKTVVVEQPSALDDLVDAIATLEPGNKNHWTKEGKPEVKALSAMLDRIVTASDRDAAWELVQENNE